LSFAEATRQTYRELFEGTLTSFVLSEAKSVVPVDVVFDVSLNLPFDTPFDQSTGLVVASLLEQDKNSKDIGEFKLVCDVKQGLNDSFALLDAITVLLRDRGDLSDFMLARDCIKDLIKQTQDLV
jgi:hypothetical protein